ncbi:MAG: hypothetical protein WCG80_17635 [Spirochaetales bacterium]
MTEFSTDIVARMIEDIARLSAQILTARQFGLEDEVLTELATLDEQADKLDPEAQAKVKALVASLREQLIL